MTHAPRRAQSQKNYYKPRPRAARNLKRIIIKSREAQRAQSQSFAVGESNCEGVKTDDDNDNEGCYQNICSCCFCHSICQLPCRAGMPRCICCSEQLLMCSKYPRQSKEPQYHGYVGRVPLQGQIQKKVKNDEK